MYYPSIYFGGTDKNHETLAMIAAKPMALCACVYEGIMTYYLYAFR
jgi:hypothetical protein